MATTKTKGTTPKIKELKGENLKKLGELKMISNEDLTRLQTTVRTIDSLTGDIGRMETQKYALLVAMQKVQSEVDQIRVDYVDKYGSDNINIQTGEIAPPQEPSIQVQKGDYKPQENGENNS